jgi:hypothetical protein
MSSAYGGTSVASDVETDRSSRPSPVDSVSGFVHVK